MTELTILMPCLNEAATVGRCIAKARGFLERAGIAGEVLVADNGSDDGSAALAHQAGARVVQVPERGYGAALAAGIASARGRYVIMGDADDSYDFGRLEGFVAKLRDGYPLVMGNRFRGGIRKGAMPLLHRYLGNPVLSFVGRLFFRTEVGDFHCGLRGFERTDVVRVCAVADRLDRRQHRGQRSLSRIPAHQRAAGGVVDVCRSYPGLAGEVRLVQPDARRAGDALDDERGLALVFGRFGDESRLHLGPVVHLQVVDHLGQHLPRRIGKAVALRVVAFQPRADDGYALIQVRHAIQNFLSGVSDVRRVRTRNPSRSISSSTSRPCSSASGCSSQRNRRSSSCPTCAPVSARSTPRR